ncbi:FHA domain-containing protein [Cumulibacter manganitolerans]|uniref:FHA domain-containing protein n=1 Tax=Cumulibacter manganitolerans TaxID=1884992 RepID=UPI001296F092|nr:FHA domain-containing protein [Cumulibacter manganitolerans]
MGERTDDTRALHHLVSEGADQPTMLVPRPDLPGSGDVYSLSSAQRRVTVGRSARCDVVLDDERVSRLHAVVRLLGARAVIEDAGSTNGTYVDGVRIEGPTELREGAAVRLGRRGPVFRYGRSFGRPGG